MELINLLFLLSGAAIAALLSWLLSRRRTLELSRRQNKLEDELTETGRKLEDKSDEVSRLIAEKVRLETRLDSEKEKLEEIQKLYDAVESEISDKFKTISYDVLKDNSKTFLEIARKTFETIQTEARGDLDSKRQSIENLIKPVMETMASVNKQINEIEKNREGAYRALTEQVKMLMDSEEKLHRETNNLVTALRQPSVRGRWGEMQLRNAIELAGMLDYCDFVEQESVATEDGLLRPDVKVRLPGGREIIIDAKAPYTAYFNALEKSDNDEKDALLREHALQVRKHIASLSAKSYWRQFDPSPDFVVMFLPGENIYRAALEYDSTIINFGVEQHVLPTSPVTLITLLRAVAIGWQQELIARSARDISKLGSDLHDRIGTLTGHFDSLGKNLARSVKAYNDAIGSLESRVLPMARRFKELGVDTAAGIPVLEPIEKTSREIQAPELLETIPSNDRGNKNDEE